MKSVRVTCEDGTPWKTRIVDTETGAVINGTTNVCVSISPHRVEAEITLGYVSTDITADGAFLVAHPVTGAMKRVALIEFEDGEKVSL